MDSNEFGFDDDTPEPLQVAASAMVQELEGSSETVSDEQYMEDVDRRLDVASTYRQLLRSPIFESSTESTQIVEAELREFVVQRLKILLNMAPVQPVAQIQAQLPFDEQELKTLKVLLATLAERAGKRVEAPSGPPQVAKAPVPVQPSQPPAVRRATPPASIPVTAKKPVGRPPGPAKAPAPPAPVANEPELVELEDPRSGQTILARRPKRQIRPRNAIPMPRGDEMFAIQHAQASGSGAAMGANATQDSVTSISSLGQQLVANALVTEE